MNLAFLPLVIKTFRRNNFISGKTQEVRTMKLLFSLTLIAASLIQGVAFGSSFSCAAKCYFVASGDQTGWQGGSFPYGTDTVRIFSVAPTMEEASNLLEAKCDKLSKNYALANIGKSVVINKGNTEYEAIVTCNGRNYWNLEDPGSGKEEFNPIKDCVQ